MRRLRALLLRFCGLFQQSRKNAELQDELDSHLALHVADNIRAGMSPEQARREALVRLGGIESVKESYRDGRSLPLLETLLQDVKFAVRMLRKNPGFTCVTVTTLALGIGANTAIFSVVNSVLLRPLPYPDSGRLVTMRSNQSLPDLEDIQAQARAFEAGSGVTFQTLDYQASAEPLQIDGALVDATLFRVLGVQPAMGRTISSEEDRFGGPRVAVLSHPFWENDLGGDRNILGKNLRLAGGSYTVIGVMPGGFSLPQRKADVFLSLRVFYPEAAAARGVHFLRTYWRLKHDWTLAQAQAEMQPIDRQLEKLHPAENKGRQTRLIFAHEWLVGDSRPALLIMFGAVGMVLLVACANFANLLLSRAISRQQEMITRAALGAGSGRLLRQMLTESVLISMLGGLIGVALAQLGILGLVALKPANLATLPAIGIDRNVLFFAFAVTLGTGLLFGWIPAWSMLARRDPKLRERSRGESSNALHRQLRAILVVAELALALVLLTGAGLLVKGFWRLRAVNPGFNPDNVVTMSIQLPASRYAEVPRQTQFREQVLDGLNSVRGLKAAMVSEVPLGGSWLSHDFVIEGREPIAPGDEPSLQSRSVMGDYFDVMQIRLLSGRNLSPRDREGSPLVAIGNEALARADFPNRSPLGGRFRWAREDGPPKWITIVGIAADVRHFGLEQPDQPAVYTPYAQSFQPWKRWMSLVVRTPGSLGTVLPLIKGQVWKVDSQVPLTRVHTMEEVMASSMAQRRFTLLLLGIFAGVAVMLAGVGVYGVISYTVNQRRNEIGIRIALGAGRKDVLRLVLLQGAALTGVGLALGLAASLGLTRLMRSMLFSVSPEDPVTFGAVAFIMACVAVGASLIPALRACGVDPVTALRYE